MWAIREQEESLGFGRSMMTKCKCVKFFCYEKNDILRFKRLDFVLLQIELYDARPEYGKLLLKLSTAGGAKVPKFVVQWPDKCTPSTVYQGQGRTRKLIIDRGAPDRIVKGEKEEHTLSEFTKRLTQITAGNEALASEIMQLFATRFASVIAKREAKENSRK